MGAAGNASYPIAARRDAQGEEPYCKKYVK